MSDARIDAMGETLAGLETPPAGSGPVPPAPPLPEQKPSLQAIDFVNGLVLTSVGNASLTAPEMARIRKIAMKAFKRQVASILHTMDQKPRRPRARKAKAVAAAPAGPPKRRGRPPKAKTVVHENPQPAVAQ